MNLPLAPYFGNMRESHNNEQRRGCEKSRRTKTRFEQRSVEDGPRTSRQRKEEERESSGEFGFTRFRRSFFLCFSFSPRGLPRKPPPVRLFQHSLETAWHRSCRFLLHPFIKRDKTDQIVLNTDTLAALAAALVRRSCSHSRACWGKGKASREEAKAVAGWF